MVLVTVQRRFIGRSLVRIRHLSSSSLSSGNGGIRANKLIRDAGICSRREADEYLSRGWVKVREANGILRIVEKGERLPLDAEFVVSGKATRDHRKKVTIALNKPTGYISVAVDSRDRRQGRRNQEEHQGSRRKSSKIRPARNLLSWKNQAESCTYRGIEPIKLRRLGCLGRLDVQSTGMLLLTQDGRLPPRVIGDVHERVEKYYKVEASVAGATRFSAVDAASMLAHGIRLDGEALLPAVVDCFEVADRDVHFSIRLIEGKNRQIRRMCEFLGLRVTKLNREAIGGLRLGELKLGEWKVLSEEEVDSLFER